MPLAAVLLCNWYQMIIVYGGSPVNTAANLTRGFTVILCQKLIMSVYAMNNYKYMKNLFQI
jgi:hypothetical protein